jgi:1-acyl-sn-glycerol-3-phosphate acyltransferase
VTKATPPAAFPSVPPPTAQGKPIKIADLRVPPLPQLDTNAPAARPATKSVGKRKSEPPKPATPPQAEAVAPQAAEVLRQAEQAPVAALPVAALPVAAPPIAASPVAALPVVALIEPPRIVEAPAEVHARTPPRPSIANTIAPPQKRARVAELRAKAEENERTESERLDVPSELAPERVRVRVRVPADVASATPHFDGPVNGAPYPALASEATARFDESSEEEIWLEGIEHTATVATGLPAEKSPRESRDDAENHESTSRLARGSTGDRAREAAAFGSSQSLLSTDYYFRQYGAHGLRSMAAEVDDFGFDPHVDAKVRPALEVLCRRYFRVELEGAEQVPEHGRALLVANRSGALPWDGLVLRTALRSARPGLSPLRWLAEDSVIHYPFMGVFMNRLGAVRACPENAERLLTQDRLVAVFPEGAQGSRKLFRDRYRLQRFGRGGYVKLALKLGVPILPTAIIGAEETNPVLGRSRLLGRFIGSDSVPITPTFPWLGLAGLLPAPVRWRIVVGAPIDLSGYGPESADDALVVHRLNEQIRSSLQTLVDQGKQQRGSALFG